MKLPLLLSHATVFLSLSLADSAHGVMSTSLGAYEAALQIKAGRALLQLPADANAAGRHLERVSITLFDRTTGSLTSGNLNPENGTFRLETPTSPKFELTSDRGHAQATPVTEIVYGRKVLPDLSPIAGLYAANHAAKRGADGGLKFHEAGSYLLRSGAFTKTTDVVDVSLVYGPSIQFGDALSASNVVAVPEPRSVFFGIALVLACGFSLRRRRAIA